MDIKEKLGAIAKTAADKTGDVVETTKLNIKANEEKSKIKKYLEQVGRIYYEKFTNGEEVDAEVADLFCLVKDAEEAIEEYHQQMKILKEK